MIGGPTASGKSALALDIAQKKNGVVINADSMQVYDGLPILTAQPPEEDKTKVPHELYGCLHPDDGCSAGRWQEFMATPLIEKLLQEGKTPVVVGGSGLYIKALMEGFSYIPDIPDDLRSAVVKKYEDMGAEAFYAELMERDPVMAKRFHVNHKARIIRAMEVLEFTGKSLAEIQEQPPVGPPEHWNFDVTLILPEREKLYRRCNDRFLAMMDNGGWEEIETFDKDVRDGRISEKSLLTHALGAGPLRRCLHGQISKDEAITLAQNETRRYAKRQVTWFRHQIKKQKNIANMEIVR